MAKHFADSNEILESQPKHLSDEETLSHTDETASSHQETHQELGADSGEKVSGSESNAASDTDASHIEDAKSATTAIQSVERYKIDTSVLPHIDAETLPLPIRMVIQLPLQPRVRTMGQPYTCHLLRPLRIKHLERSVSSGLFPSFFLPYLR